MLLKTVTFDSKTICWTNDRDYNHMFLLGQERYINDCIRLKGYIYLNQIYELLGIEWNPDDDNPCIKNDGVDRIMFIQFEVFDKRDNSVLIHISRYD